MKLKKKLAGVMAAAMAVTTLPGSMFAASVTAEAKTEVVELPEAKYAMDLDGDLDVTGPEGVTATLWTQGHGSQYQGDPVYSEDSHAGSALSTNDSYGLWMEGVQVDDSYTISTWVKISTNLAEHSPIMSVSNPSNVDNWLTWAGTFTGGTGKLWHTGNIVVGQPAYITGQWVNYTLAVDGNSAVLYENGNPIVQGNASGIHIDNTTKRVTFGVNSWSGDDVPEALYDNIKIYDETLNAVQVQALCSGTSVAVNAPAQNVRVNKTMELEANVVTSRDDVSIEWSSNSDCLKVDDNGIVTGVSEGTAAVTAKVISGEEELASSMIDISVLPEKGELIADFTFDSWEEGFQGAGAVAKQLNSEAGNLTLVPVENRGQVLDLQPAGVIVNDGLSITSLDGAGLLNDVKEFTVSYDSLSRGEWFNAWVFYADAKDDTSTSNYLSIREENSSQIKPGRITGQENEESSVDHGKTDSWKHVDVVFGQNSTQIYIDGKLINSRENTITPEMCIGNDTDVRIGDSNYVGESSGESWNGQLDNFKIYDYALTAEEIASTPVSSVTVSSASGATTVYAGNTLQLNAAAAPEDASDKSVEWTSSNPEVATVNDSGLVTAKAAGDVTITATAKDKDGKSGSIELTVKAALTYHEAVAATCAKDGNVEYWEDEESGTLYKNSAGTETTTLEEVTIPATGKHDYSITWKWVKADGDYTAAAVFKCKTCQEESEPVQAEVSKQDGTDVVTYTAKVEFNEHEYTATKELIKNYTLTVENGRITSGQKDLYFYADMVTVTADASKDGKYFSGWYVDDTLVSQKQVYTFCVLGNMTVTAKYEGEDVMKEQPVLSLRMSERQVVSGTEKEKISMTVEWSLPVGYKLKESGLVRSYTISDADELVLEKVDGSAIRQNIASNKTRNGSYVVNLTMSATTKLNPVYARGYLTFEDDMGETHTIYTEVFQSIHQ